MLYEVITGSVAPRGTLRLTAAITFGARHLAPAIAAFLVRITSYNVCYTKLLRAEEREYNPRLGGEVSENDFT